ncbi:hypothetical protein [Streptomyces zinciresistens]|nr:hypothetical protein [Streptomyces zinciresistens]
MSTERESRHQLVGELTGAGHMAEVPARQLDHVPAEPAPRCDASS